MKNLTNITVNQLNKIREAGHKVETLYAHHLWHLQIDDDLYFFGSLDEIEMFVWGYSSALPF